MKNTKDPNKLKSLQKEYGKVEDSISYSKPKSDGKKISPEDGQRKLSEIEKKMKNTKDPNALKSLEKEYGKVEDSISYAKPKEKKPGLIKEHWDSLKRERDWKKQLDNIDTLSTKDINMLANRIQLENDLKRLSRKRHIGDKEDRQNYRGRDKISDAELLNKVSRLRAKDNLVRTITESSKEQREVGKRVVGTAAGVGIRYALTGTVSTKDIAKLAMMPSINTTNKFRKSAMDSVLNKTNRTVLSRTR